LVLSVLDFDFSICKIRDIKDVNFNDEFVFVGKTDEELSLVCKTEYVPHECLSVDGGWKGLRIKGVLDFAVVGVISKITAVLSEKKIAVFVVSTFNTDYIFIKAVDLLCAVSSLQEGGYIFE